MSTRRRLKALQAFFYENLCKGRVMKAPSSNGNIAEIVRQEPKVFLGWFPMMPDESGMVADEPLNVSPSILIAPTICDAKLVEEKRFNRYNHISRPQELGQWLNVSILFSVYEPGIRLPGFADMDNQNSSLDMSKILEGTEEGLFTLMDWIDDALALLIAQKKIPDSDLFLEEASLQYSPYLESGMIVDRRPNYYGFINAKFQCYADDRANSSLEKQLQ